jgi:hypothetical protein
VSEDKYKPGPIREYLQYRECLDPEAAATVGRTLARIWSDRYFFHAWALEALTPHIDASPEVTDPPAEVLLRLSRRIGVRLTNGYLPHCHGGQPQHSGDRR